MRFDPKLGVVIVLLAGLAGAQRPPAAAAAEEAKAPAASDPAVRAGRLLPVVYPWWVEKGALPEAGTYCTAPPK